MPKEISIKISELRLDQENPCISTEDGQINIRQALLDDQGSKIGELAADISKFGLNPMDRMMVLQADVKKREFIALEGNRRAAALQILFNPAFLQDVSIPDTLRSKLTDLADNFDPSSVEPIAGVVMADRDSARRWIELRHTGQNGGRGIVDWNGVQTARFKGDRTLGLLEFVNLIGNLSTEEKAAIAANFPITTLDRIISNPAVRQKIGIQITDGDYYFLYPEAEQVKVLKKIVLDLATKKIKVDAVKSKEQQISYIDGLPATSMPSGSKMAAPKAIEDINKTASTSSNSQTVAPPSPSPLARKFLVPKGFTLTISNGKAAQLFFELKMLNIEKFPISGAVALRSFVEALIEIYCSTHSIVTKHIPKPGKTESKAFSLAEKVEAVFQHVGATMTKQEITAARTSLTGPTSVISIQRLNEYVHNPAVFPSKNDLIAAWAGVESFFKVICK